MPRQPLTHEKYAFILSVNTISDGKRKTLFAFLQLHTSSFSPTGHALSNKN